MKMFKLFVLLCIGILISCSSVKVISDYDTKVDFSSYKTFAFYKKGIDKASRINPNLVYLANILMNYQLNNFYLIENKCMLIYFH